MKKILVLRGIPASGKSTLAEEIIKSEHGWVRVNKDLIREMLHFGAWNPKNEKITQDIELGIAKHILKEWSRNIIVDDTNTSDKDIATWSNLGREISASVEIRTLSTPIEECIDRDAKRTGLKHVGPDVIHKHARALGLFNDRPDVIVDIDGTLADSKAFQDFLKSKPKNWKEFFGHAEDYLPRTEVIEKVKELSKDNNIVLVSGRNEEYKDVTVRWLKKYDVPYQLLLMRKIGDGREDVEIKKEILHKYFDKNNVVLVIDDRPKVIRMWREEGLKVEDVGNGIEF